MIKSTRIETNIYKKADKGYLTFKIDPDSGRSSTPQYEPREDIPIDWRRRMEDGTIISASILYLSITPTHNGYRDIWIESYFIALSHYNFLNTYI